jgi:hypothetical protein
MRHEAIFIDKPVVTDELDKPAPKKAHNEKRTAEKEEDAERWRRWSEYHRTRPNVRVQSSSGH